jgi:pimeloyl-ACP methyl ester carboxylesterase
VVGDPRVPARARLKPDGESHSIDRDVEDVGAVIAATGACDVFGVSSGGAIALKAALVLPSIRRVAVYEPALVDDPSSFAERVARYDRELAEDRVAAALVTAMRMTEVGPRVFGLIPGPILIRLTASMLAKEERSAAPDAVTMRALAPTLHNDFAAVLDASGRLDDFRDIRGEVLLLGGSKSPAYLRRALDRLGGIVPDARRLEFAGLGHGGSGNAAWGGRPRVVAAELRRFFA